MNFLYIVTAAALFISLLKNREKTGRALKMSLKKMWNISIPFLNMLIIISLILSITPDTFIAEHLSHSNNISGIFIASILGSVTLMPGFIAFPLCGILLEKEVNYSVLSAFSTSLMMVGLVTLPIEKKFFGLKIALVRNGLSLIIAITVALVTALFYGEII